MQACGTMTGAGAAHQLRSSQPRIPCSRDRHEERVSICETGAKPSAQQESTVPLPLLLYYLISPTKIQAQHVAKWNAVLGWREEFGSPVRTGCRCRAFYIVLSGLRNCKCNHHPGFHFVTPWVAGTSWLCHFVRLGAQTY